MMERQELVKEVVLHVLVGVCACVCVCVSLCMSVCVLFECLSRHGDDQAAAPYNYELMQR